MTRLSGEVEHIVLCLEQQLHRFRITNVDDIDTYPRLEARDVEAVTAIFRLEVVDDCNDRPVFDQSPRDSGADEAKPTSYESSLPGEVSLDVSRHFISG